VNFYDHDGEAVAAVASYVVDGLSRGERVVVVATGPHRAAVDHALLKHRINPVRARTTGQYSTLDAAKTLDTFMVDGSPDTDKFMANVGGVIDVARADGSTVRVFGEMVALLWDTGNVSGALQLESLWNDLAQDQRFSLLCAYPTTVLGGTPLGDLSRVCALHSAVSPPSSYASSWPALGAAWGERSEVFVPVPEAIGAVRRFVTSVLELWGENHLVSDAAIVISEMATNAVMHADSPFRTVIARSAGVVRLAIEDVGPGLVERHSATREDMGGRGVAIVEALSRRWGCDASPEGKIVWAELIAATS
jgi:anti-sigma regulatory factor (Ser/Thr protein kinase)